VGQKVLCHSQSLCFSLLVKSRGCSGLSMMSSFLLFPPRSQFNVLLESERQIATVILYLHIPLGQVVGLAPVSQLASFCVIPLGRDPDADL
jgi:hypothetical protein